MAVSAKSTEMSELEQFLKATYNISEQVVRSLLDQLQSKSNADIYVGRVSGSSIYRIAVGDVTAPYVIKFRTPAERDRFMMSFEKTCADAGRRIVKSY